MNELQEIHPQNNQDKQHSHIVIEFLVVNTNSKQQDQIWLVVSTHLKNMSQTGSFPQVGVNMKNI